jgi:hypothetical protein
MRMLVRKRGVVRNVLVERSEWRHLNVITIWRVVGAIAAAPYIRSNSFKERFYPFDAFQHGPFRFRSGHIAVHLCGIEDRVPASEQQT